MLRSRRSFSTMPDAGELTQLNRATSGDPPMSCTPLSRRALIRSAAVAGSAATVTSRALVPPASAVTTTPILPYGATSYFRTPITAQPVDEARTAAFRSFMRTHPDQKRISYPVITGMDGNQWGTTTHVSSATDPVWRLANPRKETQVLAAQGFHMSDDVAQRVPTGTQDRPFLVVDPIFGYSVFCADVVPDVRTRTISVSASAIFHHSSNGLDRRNPRSSDSRNWNSRGRIPDALTIRPDLLHAAISGGTGLGHVLQMFFVETLTSAGFVHPMTGTERDKFGWGAEGDRIAIRSTVDLRARGLTDAALAVARTLQTHGAYLGDNSGSSTTLKGAQTTPTYNPYAGTNLSPTCLRALTWDDFVVVKRS